jgi:hypothetical protein
VKIVLIRRVSAPNLLLRQLEGKGTSLTGRVGGGLSVQACA